MSRATHFEILARETGSWQVQAVVDSQDAAVERAHDMHRLEQSKMFKVVRVEFVNGKGEFREREICKVGTAKSDGGRYADGLDAGPICKTIDDLVSPPARRATRRVLRSWLDNVGVTALELLHHPDHLTRLENTGSMLQSAVQRSAMAQSKAAGTNLHERQKVLFRLVDELLAKLRRLWRDEDRPRLEDDNIAGLIAAVADQEDGTFLFNTAIADWLSGFKTLPEKLDGLVSIMETVEDPSHLRPLDGCLADFLDDANMVAKLLGDQNSLGDALNYIASLVGSTASSVDDEAQTEYPRLKQLIREGKLPLSRKALVRRIVSSLEGQRPLSELGLADEARVNGELHQCLQMADGSFIGGSDVADALERRSEKFVNPDAIGRLLDGITRPERRLETLLKAEAGVIGDTNKRRFGEYIAAVLRMPDNVAALREPSGPTAVYLRELATLQASLLASGITKKQKDECAEILDTVSFELLKGERIIEKIAERSDSTVSEAVAILRLCAAGTFAEGLTAQYARARILRCLSSPNFLESYLGNAVDSTEKRGKLEELQQLFDKAQLPETPLTKAVSLAVG